jgi:hypothetical protein
MARRRAGALAQCPSGFPQNGGADPIALAPDSGPSPYVGNLRELREHRSAAKPQPKGYSPRRHGDTEKVQIKGKTREHGGGGGHGAGRLAPWGVGTGIRRCSHRQSTGPNPLFICFRRAPKNNLVFSASFYELALQGGAPLKATCAKRSWFRWSCASCRSFANSFPKSFPCIQIWTMTTICALHTYLRLSLDQMVR